MCGLLFICKKQNKTLELCFKESSVSTKALHNSCGYALLHLTVTPQTIAHQASLSMGFSWQEYWSGLPFPPPADLPDPGIEATSSALASRFLTTLLSGNPSYKTFNPDNWDSRSVCIVVIGILELIEIPSNIFCSYLINAVLM